MGVDKVLLCSVLFLLQTHCCWGQSKMIVPSQSIVATVGSDVTLPCEVDPVKNLKDLVVEWARPDLRPRYIHIRRDGLDLLIDQNSQYQGRTQLWERGLQIGDMSLKLSRVRLSDGGTYRCFLPQMDTAGEVTLIVVAVSPVAVSLTKDHSGSPVLRCESRGWYPEPELLWLDSDGTVLTGGRTEVQRGVSDEIFSVSSRLSVEQSPGNTFTCRVRQQQSRQSRETQITVTGEFLEVPSCSGAWTLFSLGLCLLLAAAAAFVVWKFKLLNREKKSENEDAELGQREEKDRMLKDEAKPEVNMQGLDIKLERKEDLEKIQDDMKFVENVINKLSETKIFLPKLKEKPQEVIRDLDKAIEVETKKSIHFLAPGKDKKKEAKNELIEDLKRQKEECERTIQELDKQTKITDDLILEAAQRKGQLDVGLQNVKKILWNKESPQAAAVGPEPQQPWGEAKMNVPVATVHALDQTPGAQGEDQKDQPVEQLDTTDKDVDKLADTLFGMSLQNKKVFNSTGQM